jgi:hypothetical protein
MLFLIASIVFAMLIGLSAVMVFGPDQLPLWIEGLFWGVIGAGMVARAVEISLKEWRTRFTRVHPKIPRMRAVNEPSAPASSPP